MEQEREVIDNEVVETVRVPVHQEGDEVSVVVTAATQDVTPVGTPVVETPVAEPPLDTPVVPVADVAPAVTPDVTSADPVPQM